MAKIRRDLTILFRGILFNGSGKVAGIVVQKNNVIRIAKLKVKRRISS